MKEFNSSYSEVDEMELETLLDFMGVYEKINDTEKSKSDKRGTVTYKVID